MLKSQIQIVKEKVYQLYKEIIEHFESETFYIKCFDDEDQFLFDIPRQLIDVEKLSDVKCAVFAEITKEILKPFLDSHLEEPPHILYSVEFWDDTTLVHNFILSENEQCMLIDENKEFTLTYKFSAEHNSGDIW